MMTKYDITKVGKVVVLMGGKSAEREISLVTGKNILEALRRLGIKADGLDVQDDIVEKLLAMKPDLAFIALHGSGGEDGTIQGLLHYLKIPYTGSGVAACAITMDKTFAKLIWQSVGILTPRFRVVTDLESAIPAMNEFNFPLCVKPTTDGSSVGVTKVTTSEQLPDAFNKAATYSRKVMIEPWIEGTEYTVGILGTTALPVVQIQAARSFYDYDAKYKENTTKYICPCSMVPERERSLQELAFQAFQVTGCRGWGRVDLIEDSSGNFWFLEVNTVPGMTDHSLIPKAAQALGFSFDQVVQEILGYTLARKEILDFLAAED